MPRKGFLTTKGQGHLSISPTIKAVRSSSLHTLAVPLPVHPHPHTRPLQATPSASSEPKKAPPPPKIKITTPQDKVRAHLPTPKLLSIPQARISKAIYVPPSLDDYPTAHELQHIRLLRHGESQGLTLKDVNSSDLALTGSSLSLNPADDENKRSCNVCGFLRAWCKAAGSILPIGKSPFFDNLKPIKARSRNSTDFIYSLLQFQANRKESKLPVAAKAHVTTGSPSTQQKLGSKVGPSSPIGEASPRAEAYKAMVEGLQLLRKGQQRLQQTVLMLTFTRYALEPLEDNFAALTKLRTVLGSQIWLAALILEQVQCDNDFLFANYQPSTLTNTIQAFEAIVVSGSETWDAFVSTADTLEATRTSAEAAFTTLLSKLGKPEKSFRSVRRIRQHTRSFRSSNSGESRLKKRNSFDETSTPSYRLLYKDETQPTQSWLGFDILPEEEKFRHLEVLLQDSNWLWTSVRQSANYVSELLRADPSIKPSGSGKQSTSSRQGGSGLSGFLEVPSPGPENSPNNPFPSTPEVTSFEEGILTFCSKLGEISVSSWTPSELAELLEIEKIAADQFDLMTLAVGTVRALLYEGRHLVHLCYEFVRNMDYEECQIMLDYNSFMSKLKGEEGGKEKEGRMSSLFDVQEKEVEDVEEEYYGSVYLDIVKELPVLTNNLSLQLTLQEVEAVFSNSSVRLLAY